MIGRRRAPYVRTILSHGFTRIRRPATVISWQAGGCRPALYA